MQNNYLKHQVFTIPNLLSMFRIVLIPFIIWAYLGIKSNWLAIGLLFLSGLTDVVDGFIARRFNMVSDVGKILDPIADKFTQCGVLICLALKYNLVILLAVLFVVKEIAMGVMGLVVVKKTGAVHSAKWYGKMNTVLLYLVMGLLIIIPNIQIEIANAMIILCIASLVFSVTMYALFYAKLCKKANQKVDEN